MNQLVTGKLEKYLRGLSFGRFIVDNVEAASARHADLARVVAKVDTNH